MCTTRVYRWQHETIKGLKGKNFTFFQVLRQRLAERVGLVMVRAGKVNSSLIFVAEDFMALCSQTRA
jgi:hypothetical protein